MGRRRRSLKKRRSGDERERKQLNEAACRGGKEIRPNEGERVRRID